MPSLLTTIFMGVFHRNSRSLSASGGGHLSLSLSLAGEVAEVGRPEELKLTGGLVAKMFADAGADERRTDGPS